MKGKLLMLLFFSFSCCSKSSQLTSIHLIDQNDLSQTIQSQERLGHFDHVDFYAPQPYKKVKRIFKRNPKGSVASIVTSYHSNGQLWQALEVLDSRACGSYKEYYSSGCRKLQARVSGGNPDLTPQAQKTWVFDGESLAWTEKGLLEASINYEKGLLQGPSTFYHDNQSVWKELYYENGLLNGPYVLFYPGGDTLEKGNFFEGKKHGLTERFWENGKVAAKESFLEGKLLEASYLEKDGQIIAQVSEGNGTRVLFSKNGLFKTETLEHGDVKGLVEIYGNFGKVVRRYFIENGLKQGQDLQFDPISGKKTLSMHWNKGCLQGLVQSFYPNGRVESQKEMGFNQRNGIALSWYEDGSIRFIEHYSKDRLEKGQYFPKGQDRPCSLVINGKGCCTLFDSQGTFLQKIHYENGNPI